eukprot:SAG11_NODE_4882_length_1735_cov_2.192543_1_plen_158_part_10
MVPTQIAWHASAISKRLVRFRCTDLEWKLIYVGSAYDQSKDQELESILVGPIPVGLNKIVFQVSRSVLHRPTDAKYITAFSPFARPGPALPQPCVALCSRWLCPARPGLPAPWSGLAYICTYLACLAWLTGVRGNGCRCHSPFTCTCPPPPPPPQPPP